MKQYDIQQSIYQALVGDTALMDKVEAVYDNVPQDTSYPYEGNVFSPVEYAFYLEFGTSRMAARPFLFPSVEEERPIFMKALKEILS